MGLAFRIPALAIETDVPIDIVKQPRIETGALLALAARSGLGREVRVIGRKRRIREMEIHVLFNPGSKRTGRKQMGLFVLPVLPPAMLIGFSLARFR